MRSQRVYARIAVSISGGESMRHTFVLAMAGCIALLGGWSLFHRPTAGAPEPTRKSDWAYKVELLGPHGGERNPEKLEKVLNEMGADGWELIQSAAYSDAKGPSQLLVVFKRPK